MSPSQAIFTRIEHIEHIEHFTAHKWCNALLSDPFVTHISKCYTPEKREDGSNTFLMRTLFTDNAIRAFLTLYKPGNGRRREQGEEVLIGSAALHEARRSGNEDAEERWQTAKEEKLYDVNDPDAPEAIILVSIGNDMDGGARRLHGGVTATLLDQVMGTLILYMYKHTCATSDLNIKFKQAVTTPCVLLVRAKMLREQGRWIETRGWIEDGQGKIFAEGRGAFVMSKLGNAKM